MSALRPSPAAAVRARGAMSSRCLPMPQRQLTAAARTCSSPHTRARALVSAKAAGKEGVKDEKKSDEYSKEMSAKMGTSLTYRHEEGLNYNRILPDLIVGSCLQTAADVDRLAEQEGVKVVFCLQEDSDMEYFNLDITKVQERCEQRGDIKHVRFPIRDFDPFDLRRKLPKAVARLSREHDPALGTVYIHCTAGLGRAPATALAYMAWVRGMPVDPAMEQLTSIRRCSPKIESIRSATADLLLGNAAIETTISMARFGTATTVQVAGLDVGWHQMLDLAWDPVAHRFAINRTMLPGKYQFKFIVDGQWTYSADHQTVKDGDHINNIQEVIGPMDEVRMEKMRRYMSPGCVLSEEEQGELQAMLCPWSSHDGLVGAKAGALQEMLDEVRKCQEKAEAA